MKSEKVGTLKFVFSEIFGEMRQPVNLMYLLFLRVSLNDILWQVPREQSDLHKNTKKIFIFSKGFFTSLRDSSQAVFRQSASHVHVHVDKGVVHTTVLRTVVAGRVR